MQSLYCYWIPDDHFTRNVYRNLIDLQNRKLPTYLLLLLFILFTTYPAHGLLFAKVNILFVTNLSSTKIYKVYVPQGFTDKEAVLFFSGLNKNTYYVNVQIILLKAYTFKACVKASSRTDRCLLLGHESLRLQQIAGYILHALSLRLTKLSTA